MIKQLINVILYELLLNRMAVIFGFAGVSLLMLVVAWAWPVKYESKAVIFADQKNIIGPLLQSSATTTSVVNRVRVVREVMQSRRLLSGVVEKTGLLTGTERPEEIERIINKIRSGMKIEGVGDNYIRINFQSSSANRAYLIASTITERFLKDSSERKRGESKAAYSFIDSQVKSYKSKLQEAEDALREFNATNVDGTEDSVNSRINQLRISIEERELDFEGLETRKASLQNQLASEGKFAQTDYKASIYHQQINALRGQLSTLKLSLTDTHPDITNIRIQIKDLEDLAKRQSDDQATNEDAGAEFNPVYQELRSALVDVNVQIREETSRLASTRKLLDAEYERRKRVANLRAALAELTRDYNVTRGIYEDMLERKERARLSLTLDIEGQGVTYKVQEPAAFPLNPTGIRFMHLFFLGPLVGLMVPFALIVLFVQVDPRIRIANIIKDEMELPLLAVIPHMTTHITERIPRRDFVLLGGTVLLVGSVYCINALIRVGVLDVGGFLG